VTISVADLPTEIVRDKVEAVLSYTPPIQIPYEELLNEIEKLNNQAAGKSYQTS
jgi:hypothetical protein